MTDNTVVEVDYWENQTYKQLQGGWSVPYYGVPKYSDATGKVTFKQEKTMTGTVFLPLGWEWVDKTWEIDKSGKYGECDAEGWSYSTTFELLVENTRTQTLKADKNNASMMRRRRWIRNRRCVIPDVVRLHVERVDWADGIRNKISEILTINTNNHAKLSEYYGNQKEAIERVVVETDNNILDAIHEFNSITERLIALRTFLVERGTIEETYAQKIDIFSKKWMNENETKRYIPGPYVAQSSPYLLTSDPAVDIFAEEGTAALFWNTTTSALKTAAATTTQVASSAATNAATAATLAASAATTVVNVASANVRRLSLSDIDLTGVTGETNKPPKDISTANTDAAEAETESRSASTSNATDTTTQSAVVANAKPSRGILDDYYYSVCLAYRTVSQRLQTYAHSVTQGLPEQVDGILEVVKDAVNECRTEGREIRSSLMTNCRSADQRFATYSQCYEASQAEMKAESHVLFAAVHQSSATLDVPDTTNLYSLSAATGGYGDATAAGDAAAAAINRFNNLESVDLWLAINQYFSAATAVDSDVLMYHAFSKMQLRKLKEISTTIDEVLQVTLKTFCTEQFRAWEDCSAALAALGAYKDLLVLQIRGPTASSSRDQGDGSPRRLGRADSHNSDFQEVGEAGAGELVVPPKSPGRGASTPGRKALREGGAAVDPSMQDVGLSEEQSDVNSGRDIASGFRSAFFRDQPTEAYVSHHGRLNYYTSTRAEASSGGVDFTEHSIWHEAIVLVTYDRVLHILQVPREGIDDLRFSEERRILSVNIRNVLVRPFAIPKEGYRDAFEVLLAGSGSKKMSLLGSLGSSGKDITAIVFLTHDSFQMRTWMRAISNPFTDTSKDPPDSPVPVAAPSTTAAGSTTSTTFGSVAASAGSSSPGRVSSTVEPSDGFSYGGADDIVGGTNSLRELGPRGLSAKLNPSTPARSAPEAASSSSLLSSSDNFSGTNMLRTASFKTGASAPQTGTAATPVASGASSSGVDGEFSGTNLMRTASFRNAGMSAKNTSPTRAASNSSAPVPAPEVHHTSTPSNENFVGANALRRMRKVPSSMGPQAGVGAAPAGSAAATAAASADGGAFSAVLKSASRDTAEDTTAPAVVASDSAGEEGTS